MERINERMTDSLEKQANDFWIESVGGLAAATALVAQVLNCGFSKAEKVAAGRYPSKLPSEQAKAIAELKKMKARRGKTVVTRQAAKGA